MLKTLVTLMVTIGIIGFVATPGFAAEKKGKEITVTGEGKCAKCMLKETDACQNVIEVAKGNKKQVYYLAQNDVSKSFHKNICQKTQTVTATGTVKKVKGKLELTPTKLDLATAEK